MLYLDRVEIFTDRTMGRTSKEALVQKHLARVQRIGHAKGKTKPTPTDIEAVCVQSFCAGDHYRPFVVRVEEEPEPENIENTFLHANPLS